MRILLIFFVLSLAHIFSPLMAMEYDINMSRRAKTGDRYYVECSFKDAIRYEWIVDGSAQPATQIGRSIILNADAETVEAGKGGSEVHIRLAIKKFSYKIDDEEKIVLPAGGIIDAKWEKDKTVYLLDEKPVDEELKQALSSIFFAETPDYSPDDRIAGTSSKQAVGQKWPINAEALAEHLTTYSNLPSKAENITGFMTISEVTNNELKILTDCTVNKVEVKFEPWLTVTNSKVQFNTVAFYPIDVQQRPTKKSYRNTLSASGAGDKDGIPHRLNMIYRFASDYDMKPLP